MKDLQKLVSEEELIRDGFSFVGKLGDSFLAVRKEVGYILDRNGDNFKIILQYQAPLNLSDDSVLRYEQRQS